MATAVPISDIKVPLNQAELLEYIKSAPSLYYTSSKTDTPKGRKLSSTYPSARRYQPPLYTSVFKSDWTDNLFFAQYVPSKCYQKPSYEQHNVACKNLISFFKGDIAIYPDIEKDFLMAILCIKYPSRESLIDELVFQKVFNDETGDKMPSSNVHAVKLRLSNNLPCFWGMLWNAVDGADMIQVELGHSIVGFYCLYALRLFSKEALQVWNSMNSSIHHQVQSHFKTTLEFKCQPACLKNLKNLKPCCSETNRALTGLLATVLARYYAEECSDNPSMQIRDLLDEACLLNIAKHGMNTLVYSEQISGYIHRSIAKVLRIVCTSKTLTFVADAAALLHYAGQPSSVSHPLWDTMHTDRQVTWEWARLFDCRQFGWMASKYNMVLTIRLLAIMAHYEGKEYIMQMRFLRPRETQEEFIELFEGYAKATVEKYGDSGKKDSDVCKTTKEPVVLNGKTLDGTKQIARGVDKLRLT